MLVLGRAEYLPLRTATDLEITADPASQADPVLPLLASLGGLPPGWRALSQLVLAPAPRDWARGYARRALEDPIARERTGGGGGLGMPLAAAVALLIAAGAGPRLLQWYWTHDWLRLGGLGLAAGAAVVFAVWLCNHVFRHEPDDPRLVREKIGPPAYRAQLRLTVFAPADVAASEVAERACALAGAYGQFDLAAGNTFISQQLRVDGGELRAPHPIGRAISILNVRELASLWHLPQRAADAPYLPRTTARRRLPLPCTVAHGCRIGVERHLGREEPIALSDEILREHMLLVAKTGQGKSTLLMRIARHLIAEGQRAVMVVDPHADLAEGVLGCVPPDREKDVVYLDVGEERQPFGLNLLDVGLGWTRTKAVDNAIQIFKREFDRFWGPRMEDAFWHGLATLYEANEKVASADQYTLLDVPPLLSDGAFRRTVLDHKVAEDVAFWWTDYFNRLDPKLQLEIVNPVLTKVHRYSGNEFSRRIVGQPRSTINPASWLQDRKIVVVNTNKAVVGENAAALIGATLLNLTALVVGAQARFERAERPRITILVDEFQTMPGADYEAILSELAKYGANLVLATQSLARLDALDREHQRSLKAMVFSNIDALFAFHVSAEDASYLVRELDEEKVGEQDLVSLGEHRCYARLSAGPKRLEVYSVELEAPQDDDAALRDRLIGESADRYGLAVGVVDEHLKIALGRVKNSHGSMATEKPQQPQKQQADKKQEQGGAAAPDVANESPFPDAEPTRESPRDSTSGTEGDAGDACHPEADATSAPSQVQEPTEDVVGRPELPQLKPPSRPSRADPSLPRNFRRNRRGELPAGVEQASFVDAEGNPLQADKSRDAAA